MKPFVMRSFVTGLCATGMLSISSQAMASAFQLWEQDGANVGNYHAGYAAEADSASTAWFNPAGITRIKNQQLVVAAVGIGSDFRYKGDVIVSNAFPPPIPPISQVFPGVTAQGGNFSIVPDIHYVIPINDWMGFGFSVDAPFGLKTNYGYGTPLRYAATLTSIEVIDASPSIGFKVTDKASLGIGFDVQHVSADFNSVGLSVTTPDSDTVSKNTAHDYGYGYHLGALYEFTPDTRVGISYHSQVAHVLTGSSKFFGPLAFELNGGDIRSHANTHFRLPGYTALSGYHRVIPQVAIMGSLIYTQWNVFKTLSLHNVSGIDVAPFPEIAVASKTIDVSIPENYRNTWNVSVGADYFITDKITLRSGVGYDQTPIRNKYRNVQLPDADRYVIAFGSRFQITKTLALNLGWTHLFMGEVHVNPPPAVTGAQIVETKGKVSGGADVYSGQLTWDIV